jgi:perosamine synthetase
VTKKREIFKKYKDKLSHIKDLQFNAEPQGVFNSVWVTGLVFGKSHNMTKKEAMKRQEEMGLPSRPFFYPLSSLPAYPDCNENEYQKRNPIAYDVSSRGINLSCAFNLDEEQIDAICNGIKHILDA